MNPQIFFKEFFFSPLSIPSILFCFVARSTHSFHSFMSVSSPWIIGLHVICLPLLYVTPVGQRVYTHLYWCCLYCSAVLLVLMPFVDWGREVDPVHSGPGRSTIPTIEVVVEFDQCGFYFLKFHVVNLYCSEDFCFFARESIPTSDNFGVLGVFFTYIQVELTEK